MENLDSIQIEVAYAKPGEQMVIPLKVFIGTTAQQAIETSDILLRFQEIDLNKNKIGIFGKLCKLNTPLRENDRVEIYRPLIADPKEIRKQRAAQGKKMKKNQ
ncbi:RnfH family protein [Candidatus Parabeggiatoa sp. HSG14]|uniref:RnfH family protein n=1 Tax=Candidatus Parabeggiatoa sp. HSG14 TaxID=3055593 RepID=UPI0025A86B3D|nr:RnfH family protein [Thiotrichales bacterium HSG14]